MLPMWLFPPPLYFNKSLTAIICLIAAEYNMRLHSSAAEKGKGNISRSLCRRALARMRVYHIHIHDYLAVVLPP